MTGLIKSWSQDPESGSSQNCINPFWLAKTPLVTAKMPVTHHRDFVHQLRVLLVFFEFNTLICILMERQRRTHLNPPPLPAIQPPAQPQPQPAPRRRRKPPYPSPFKDKKKMLHQPLTNLIHTDIPRYQNFVRMPPVFFDHQFRKPLEVGLKLAITLRHLANGETYTSLQYHWLIGRTAICKFVPQVC